MEQLFPGNYTSRKAYWKLLNMRLCRKPVKQSFISTIDEIRFIRFKIVQPESAPKQTG